MLKFEWHDDVPIDYGDGIVFNIKDDFEAFNERFKESSRKLNEAIKKFHGKDKKAELNAYLEAIDELLGEGATEKLFEHHSLTETNIVAAYLFIPDCFRDFQENAAALVKATGERICGKPSTKTIPAQAQEALDDVRNNPPTGTRLEIVTAQAGKARL